jgi:hypothetical protein
VTVSENMPIKIFIPEKGELGKLHYIIIMRKIICTLILVLLEQFEVVPMGLNL